jgi:hypothetical protein
LRSNDPCPKCGGEKPHKGRSPTAVFRSLAAYWRRTVTVLLCAGLRFYNILIFIYFKYFYGINAYSILLHDLGSAVLLIQKVKFLFAPSAHAFGQNK